MFLTQEVFSFITSSPDLHCRSSWWSWRRRSEHHLQGQPAQRSQHGCSVTHLSKMTHDLISRLHFSSTGVIPGVTFNSWYIDCMMESHRVFFHLCFVPWKDKMCHCEFPQWKSWYKVQPVNVLTFSSAPPDERNNSYHERCYTNGHNDEPPPSWRENQDGWNAVSGVVMMSCDVFLTCTVCLLFDSFICLVDGEVSSSNVWGKQRNVTCVITLFSIRDRRCCCGCLWWCAFCCCCCRSGRFTCWCCRWFGSGCSCGLTWTSEDKEMTIIHLTTSINTTQKN